MILLSRTVRLSQSIRIFLLYLSVKNDEDKTHQNFGVGLVTSLLLKVYIQMTSHEFSTHRIILIFV